MKFSRQGSIQFIIETFPVKVCQDSCTNFCQEYDWQEQRIGKDDAMTFTAYPTATYQGDYKDQNTWNKNKTWDIRIL